MQILDRHGTFPPRRVQGCLTAPAIWNESLSGPPILDRKLAALVPITVRRWQGISPAIEQVALDQHYISIHLGGPKRLTRNGEGSLQNRDVDSGAHSVVPSGSAFRWNTEGPVDFAHFYFDVKTLDDIVQHSFDRDPAQVTLSEDLGRDDPLIACLALGLLEEIEADDFQQAYVDDLVHLFATRVLRLHSDAQVSCNRACNLLAPHRLNRSYEFIEANLGSPIGVAEIASAAGISAYHFSRAFRQTTGRPPYAFLIERRIALAKDLLAGGVDALADVASQCGFTSLSQFSRMFRREVGTTPTRFRDGR